MPLCYGGGINKLDIAKKVFDLGVEKICLQSIVLKDYTVSKIRKSSLAQLLSFDYVQN